MDVRGMTAPAGVTVSALACVLASLVMCVGMTCSQAHAEGPGGPGPGAPPGGVPGPEAEEGHRGDLLADLEDVRGELASGGADAAARLAYAQLLLEAGAFEEAREQVRPLLELAESTTDAAHTAARLAYYMGDYEEAERLFREVLERDPGNARALTGLVFTHYQTNEYEKCATLPVGEGANIRLPHLDLMLAFDGETPYRMAWADERRTVVPFIATDPLPIIEVEIAGAKVTVLIDTGADVFVLDTEIAESLGIEAVTSMMGMFAGGKQAEIGFAVADSLRLGGVTLRSVPISLLPTDLSLGEHEIGGIVGTSVLRQFLSTLDYPNERLVLRERSTESLSDFLEESEGRIVEKTPFYLQGTHFILTRGSLNGYERLLFHIDSGLAGVPSFAAPRQTLEYVGIPVPEVEVHEGVIGGGGGGFATGTFEIATLGLGGLRQSDLVGSFGGQPPGSYRRLGFIVDGLISHNFLREYAWTLDFDSMRMVFTQ